MADRFALLDERNAVLIVVAAVRDEVPHVEKLLGQFQIARLARRAIELDHRHVVRRADRVAGQLRRRLAERLRRESRPSCARSSGIVAARHAMVQARGRDQMPHVVHLEIVPVLKRLRVASPFRCESAPACGCSRRRAVPGRSRRSIGQESLPAADRASRRTRRMTASRNL